MKKLLSVLALLSTSIMAMGANNITFADTNVKAICVENWDTNHDNELSYEEAAAVTNLGDVFFDRNDITSFDEFQFFTGVTQLEIPKSGDDGPITIIDWGDDWNEDALSGTFAKCYSLKSIIIPQSVTSIGKHAFANCSSLTSIEIPSSVTSIGESAFYGCNGIKVIVKDLKAWCNIKMRRESHGEFNQGDDWSRSEAPFQSWYLYSDKNKSVTNLVIPDGTTVIRDGVFENCKSLTSVTISGSVKTMEYAAFYNCPNLTTITLNDGATSIGKNAFSGCEKLASVTIPSSVTTIGGAAFSGCNDVKFIVKDLAAWCGIDFDNENVFEAGMPMNNPSNPLQAGFLYSDEDTPVTNLVIPDGVTAITKNAFYACKNLKSIAIPNSVKSIGAYAFADIIGPSSVVIPNGVTYIGCSAFASSSLTSVNIGSHVEEIGILAFFGCFDLTSVTVNNPNPPIIGYSQDGDPSYQRLFFDPPTAEDVFSNYENITLYVPQGAKTAYQTADVWKEFLKIEEKKSSGGLKGDMNNDGVLDITDALIIIDYVLGRDVSF